MKVRCKTQCQKDRKILFKVNEEYDIDKEMYQKNKEFFEKIKENNKEQAWCTIPYLIGG